MKTNSKTWKPVTIGGFTGILMGAGAMHLAQSTAFAANVNGEEPVSEKNSLDDLSFREAFDTARAEMGPGGVFTWRGNLYNTYTAAEWQSMSDAKKEQFTEEVAPEISAQDIDESTISDIAKPQAVEDDPDVSIANDPVEKPELTTASNNTEGKEENADDDVRIVGFGDVTLEDGRVITVQEMDFNGQRVAVIDLDHDGTADIAMSDLNNNRQMDEGEVIDLHTGEALTFTNDEIPVDNIPVDGFDA